MTSSLREETASLLVLLIFSVGFFSPSLAQETAISGNIYNKEEKPIPFATIATYDSTGENLITGTQSDETGTFYLELDPGDYLLHISSVSYEEFEEVISLEAGEIRDFPEIILEQSPESLDDIDIEAERSQMQLDFDKRVFQVGTDVTTVGGSAIDVLDNVPSITTDIEGNVSLRGSEGVRILINGKPSSTYSNGSGALRGLPANMIEEIEVITNPSARYEAEGSAGIINIILKKNEELGFNGNIAAGIGYPGRYETSSSLNYRVNNINWFLNTSIDYDADSRSSWSFQRYSSADTSYMYRENSSSEDWEIDGNIRFGADFYLTTRQTLTASVAMDMEYEEDERVVNYTDLTIEDEVIQDVRRNDFTEEDESDFEFEMQYENLIDEDEHALTADFDIDISIEKERSDLNEIIEEGLGEPLLQRTTNRESETDYRLRADYKRPLSEESKIEAGINSSYEYLENEFVAEEQQNNEWVLLDTFNDNFTYHEIVNAAYGIFSTRFGKFSTQLGLRLEQTIIDTKLRSSGEGSEQ